MDDKGQNLDGRNVKTEGSVSNLLFNGNDFLIFIFKKTEKIVSAIHLVTNLMSAEEPLKWTIRKISLRLLSESLSLTGKTRAIHREPFEAVSVSFVEVLSHLEVAYACGLLSRMNYAVVKQEIEEITGALGNKGQKDKGTVLLESGMFAVEKEHFHRNTSLYEGFSQSSFRPKTAPKGIQNLQDLRKLIDQGHKGQDYIKDSNVLYSNEKDNDLLNRKQRQHGKGLAPGYTKKTRREAVIDLLRNRPNLSIKDFSAVIKGYSEKTIQRELLSLVASGVLKKQGERRWSTYSLL